MISTINRQSCIAALVIFLIIGRSTADTAKIEGSSKEKWHFDSPEFHFPSLCLTLLLS